MKRNQTKAHFSHRSGRLRKYCGFTLAELIACIAIILVLAGLIFPVVGRARSRAGLSACSSNLRQLYHANALYAADYGGHLPPYTTFTSINDPRIPLIFRTDRSRQLVDVLDPYIRSRDIWFCPADPFAGTEARVTVDFSALGVNHTNTSYRTGNSWYGPGGTADPHLGSASIDMSIWNRLLGVERASSELVMFTDLLWQCADPKDEDGVIFEGYYSHGERFNIVYFDGHIMNFARGKNGVCPDK